MNTIRLSSKRKIEDIEEYIFPDDVYEIPGFLHFQDIDALNMYTMSRLKKYQNGMLQVYLNGGLTLEILSVIRCAKLLDISLKLMHRNAETNTFVEQKVRWEMFPDQEKKVDLALCENRHDGMPQAIFEEVGKEKIFDFAWQEQVIKNVLKDIKETELRIYVTGLTPLLVSVLNVAADQKIPVTCMHYDVSGGAYFPQKLTV